MVAVGDDQLLIQHLTLNFPDNLRGADAPEAQFIAVILLDLEQRREPFDRERKYSVDRWLGLSIKREDRAQLRVAGKHQLEPIFPRCVMGFFMRPDIAAAQILEFRESDKTFADFLFAGLELEALRQKINRRLIVALENSLALPLIQQLSDGTVGFRLLAEVQSDKIIRRFLIKLFLFCL